MRGGRAIRRDIGGVLNFGVITRRLETGHKENLMMGRGSEGEGKTHSPE